MAVPAELRDHAAEPGIGAFSRTLRCIHGDLGKVASKVSSVELLRKDDQRSALRKFFALEKAADADHWLAVNAVVLEREVRILAPFRRGLSLPYSVEIALNAPLSVIATYRRGLILRAEWIVEPDTLANRAKPKQLVALRLPEVGWRHDSGGIPIALAEGGRIGVSAGGQRRVTWTVHSAYQGFLFNVGPRIVKYVQAAPRLEALLSEWLVEQANPPSVPARPPPTSHSVTVTDGVTPTPAAGRAASELARPKPGDETPSDE